MPPYQFTFLGQLKKVTLPEPASSPFVPLPSSLVLANPILGQTPLCYHAYTYEFQQDWGEYTDLCPVSFENS